MQRGDALPDRLDAIGGTREILCCKHVRTPMARGDVWYHSWQAGGGYGDPLLREPAQVADDVVRRAVSPGAAQDIYGVVVGRDGRADPKWLLPFQCRRGHVTRQEIGRIRVLARETQFEVAPYVAQRFAAAARRAEGEDAHIRIIPMQPVKGTARRPRQ